MMCERRAKHQMGSALSQAVAFTSVRSRNSYEQKYRVLFVPQIALEAFYNTSETLPGPA